MNKQHIHIITIFLISGGYMHGSEESSIMQKISTWLTTKSPSTGCALVGSLGASLEGLPTSAQRSVYKNCGWYFLGVTKDGKTATSSERHPNAFEAVTPAPHQYANAARDSFVSSHTKWDDWADGILKKYPHKI